jgi:hypothetical protein
VRDKRVDDVLLRPMYNGLRLRDEVCGGQLLGFLGGERGTNVVWKLDSEAAAVAGEVAPLVADAADNVEAAVSLRGRQWTFATDTMRACGGGGESVRAMEPLQCPSGGQSCSQPR